MTQQEKFTELAKLEKQLKTVCNKLEKLSVKFLRTDPEAKDTDHVYSARYWANDARLHIASAKQLNEPF